MIQKFGTLLLTHMDIWLSETTWEHLSSWHDQKSQSTYRTEYEAQLLLHCSFTKCNKTFNMAYEVLHNCAFSPPKDLTLYHSCDAKTEVQKKVNAYMQAITGTGGGVRDITILVLDLGIRWGMGLVPPPTANLLPGKRPGMHCRRD